MTVEMVSVIDAALELRKRKQTLFKVMKRLGITGARRRDPSKGNQVVLFISRTDFDRIRCDLGSVSRGNEQDDTDIQDIGFYPAEKGVFYLIQLEPDHDPKRFKVGFAADITERLRAIRCAAPFATVLKTWDCRRLWEKTAIDCVTFNCEQIHTEVFRTTSVEDVARRCDNFFGMMPVLNDKKNKCHPPTT
jgi:hypothetical protein